MSSAATVSRANQDLASAVREAEERYASANPLSAAQLGKAARAMPGGNTRTTIHFSPFPLCMAKGEGARLVDLDGHSYADFVNEYTAGLFGHSNQIIVRAIEAAAKDGIVLGAPNKYEALLAAEVTRRFPSMERVRFCNSGTEGNLLALSTARAVTGRSKIMAFEGAYHGSLLYFGRGGSPLTVPFPAVVSVYNDPERARADIRAHAESLAAVIVEPMQGSAGAIAGEAAFLETLRAACDEAGVLLIFDEVMTSRLSPAGAQGLYGIRPDLTTLGKYLAGGLTIGAFGGREGLMARFDPSAPGAFPHGGTFNNNVLAMAAGHAALSQVLTAASQEAMNKRGDRLRDRLNAIAGAHGLPLQVTGIGSIFGIHFHRGPIRNTGDLERGEAGREEPIRQLKTLFHLDMLAAGQYLSRRLLGNLSLETSEADVDGFCDAVEEFLASRGGLIRGAVEAVPAQG
jgi:glutamate-1-semialdehyde 2,1-aminomutase